MGFVCCAKFVAMFLQEDARVVEINPLVKTKSGQWYLAMPNCAGRRRFLSPRSMEKFSATDYAGRLPTDRATVKK